MRTSYLRNILTDDKSRIIFDARIEYKSDKRLTTFYNKIKEAGDNYRFREIDEFISSSKVTSLYIWGDDDYALYSYQVLKDSGYPIKALICKTDYYITCDVPVISLENLDKKAENAGIILFQRDNKDVPKCVFANYKVLELVSHVVGRSGNQYFDFLAPKKREIFLDAGCLDGETSKAFVEWCEGDYEAIYAFEANPAMARICRKNLEAIADSSKLHFYELALWNKCEKVAFDNTDSKWNAHITSNGNMYIAADSVDNILGGDPVTYIKFDIEGSEIQALYGAKGCIKKNRPRMAISVYHNDDDLENIMEFLIQLWPNYKFSLRHYHSDSIETILYAY